MEPEFVGDFSSIHCVGKILFVGKDKQERIAKLILVEHPLQLLPSLRHTFPIVRVHNKDDTLSILEVCKMVKDVS